MKRTLIAPMGVLLGLIGSVALMAFSDVFTPLIQFIHSGVISPLQAGACIVFSVAGFAACYFLLSLLCSYFVPRMITNSGGSGALSQTTKMEGDDRPRVK